MEKNQEKNVEEVLINNTSQLIGTLLYPQCKIIPNAIIDVTYITNVKLNKGYNYNGYFDTSGISYSGESIEVDGKKLGKKWLSDFYDTDNYKEKKHVGKRNGVANPFTLFRTIRRKFTWFDETHNNSLEEKYKAICDASKDELMNYVSNDATFNKKCVKYAQSHSIEVSDLILSLKQNLDKELIYDVYRTSLLGYTPKWNKVNDCVSKYNENEKYGLRLLSIDTNIESEYYLMTDDNICHITREEAVQLEHMFGSPSKDKPNETVIHTKLGDTLKEIGRKNPIYHDYPAEQVVTASFELKDKTADKILKFKFENDNVQIPKAEKTMSLKQLTALPFSV